MLLKKNIPFRYIVGKIRVELLVVSLYATLIALVHHFYGGLQISLPLGVPMIMGTVISLLLAFRSNQAYDRWWEARGIWGAIVNDSRTLARQVNTLSREVYQGDEYFFFKQRFIKRQIAWCYALSRSLRQQDPMERMDRLLVKRDLEHLAHFTNKPMALLELHGVELQHALDNGWINQFQQVELDRTLSRLCDAMGKCERIKNTIFPATYGLYIHFSLVFFFLLLPFSLIEVFGSMLFIPAMVAISTVFFLVEKMAIHLQDPFESKPTDTPMTAICATIERDLRQMIQDENSWQPIEMETRKIYYVL